MPVDGNHNNIISIWLHIQLTDVKIFNSRPNRWHNKKFELMLTKREKTYNSSGSVV